MGGGDGEVVEKGGVVWEGELERMVWGVSEVGEKVGWGEFGGLGREEEVEGVGVLEGRRDEVGVVVWEEEGVGGMDEGVEVRNK